MLSMMLRKRNLSGDRVKILRKTVVCEVCDIQKIISKYSEY